jgi:hypothetical protein
MYIYTEYSNRNHKSASWGIPNQPTNQPASQPATHPTNQSLLRSSLQFKLFDLNVGLTQEQERKCIVMSWKKQSS